MAGIGGLGFLMQSLGIDTEVVNTAARNIIDIGEAVKVQLDRIEARLDRIESMQTTIVVALNEAGKHDAGNAPYDDDANVHASRTNGTRRISKVGGNDSA